MANWIKMRVDLADDPAVIGIAAALQVDEDTVVGKLHRIWSWFDGQTIDGNAPRVTAAWIDRRISCPGFAAAMIDVGWLQANDNGLSLPEFDRHNGETGKARAVTAKRVANHKRASKDSGHSGNAVGNATGNAATVTNRVPRIEREKNKNREDSSLESDYKNTSSSSPAACAIEKPTGWEEVEEGLARLKVSLIRKAVDSARDHGFTVPQVLALIAYLETNPPGCQSAKGAIFNRLVEQADDSVHWDADQHWPWSDPTAAPPDPTATPYPVKPESPQSRDEQLARERQRVAELERLTTAHLATLQGMDSPALDKLIAEAPIKSQPELKRLVRSKGRDSPLVQQTLLELLDKRPP